MIKRAERHTTSFYMGAENKYCQANSIATVPSNTKYSTNDRVQAETKQQVLFEIFSAKAIGKRASMETVVFVDPGSSLNFIRNEVAQQLCLEGEPVTYNIRVVNSSYRELKTKKYRLDLRAREMKENYIEVIGIPSITDTIPLGDITDLKNLFPNAPAEAFNRPTGAVDIMLGMPARELHATTGVVKGETRLDVSKFGCGHVFTGVINSKEDITIKMSSHALSLKHAEVVASGTVFFLSKEQGPVTDFYEAEDLGCAPPPVCPSCKGCKESSFRRGKMSKQEAVVLDMVEKSMI